MSDKEYELCVMKLADNVMRFLVKNTSDYDLSSDILQETFLKIWEKRKEIEYSKSKSYIFTTAYRTMIDEKRRQKRRDALEYEEEIDERQPNNLEEIIEKALAILPLTQRSAIMLRDYEGYSYDEIAEILEINLESVKVNIFRARVKLKKHFGKIDNLI